MAKKFTTSYVNISTESDRFLLTVDSQPNLSASFSFLLNSNQLNLGEITIPQLWIPKNQLYAKKGQKALNFRNLTNFFWKSAQVQEAACKQGLMESYLLAKLLPETLTNCSAKVCKDSALSKKYNICKTNNEFITQLDAIIRADNQSVLSNEAFWQRTREILGPVEARPEVKQLYDEMAKELFPNATMVTFSQADKLFEEFRNTWRNWYRKISRRNNNKIAQEVMNLLSYEARTAFFRCYSHFWDVFTTNIKYPCNNPRAFYLFHRLWHLTPVTLQPDNPDNFWFHGHIFGLHPAGSYLLLTEAGRLTVQKYLQTESDQDYQRFLQAYIFSCYLYESELVNSRKEGGFEARLNYMKA